MVLAAEPEFEQARNELAITIAPFLAKYPEYERAFEIVQVIICGQLHNFGPCPSPSSYFQSTFAIDLGSP
jgi:hypothetical protein